MHFRVALFLLYRCMTTQITSHSLNFLLFLKFSFCPLLVNFPFRILGSKSCLHSSPLMQLANMMWNVTWLAEDPQVGNCVTFAWHLIIIIKTTTLCDSRCFKHSLWLWGKSRTNVVQLPVILVVLRWHALSGFLCSLGQAGAIRLGISRALLSFEDSYLEPLQKGLRQCCYRAFSDVGLCRY